MATAATCSSSASKGCAPFVNQNKLGSDKCAIKARNLTNDSILDYQLWNTYNCKKDESIDSFGADNINLHFKNGYGVTSPCLVDKDTELRINGVWTNEKAKSQMFTRFYVANPNLSKGTLLPYIESRLVQGENTGRTKDCFYHGEADFDRFMPLLPCIETEIQDTRHIIMPFARGGEDSRQVMRGRQPMYDRYTGTFIPRTSGCV